MSLCGSKTDTSGMNAAALANSQVAKDALDWYKQAYTCLLYTSDAADE